MVILTTIGHVCTVPSFARSNEYLTPGTVVHCDSVSVVQHQDGALLAVVDFELSSVELSRKTANYTPILIRDNE